ncbi:class I SAM-dependent methyltransferase [Streptomyces xiamenensis]
MDSSLFLSEALRGFRTTGAIAPSGRRLAARLAAPVRRAGAAARGGPARRPLTVLEAGGGTGAVTRALLPLLGPGDRLDVVEANARFAARLRRLTTGPTVEVRVHHTYVERLAVADGTYDVIVSGLPFANFDPEEVETIMTRYRALLKPGGTLTYFAYPGARLWHSPRQRDVARVLAGHHVRPGVEAVSETVWTNLPPARVWRLTTAP